MEEDKKPSEEQLLDYAKHYNRNAAYRLLKKLRKVTRNVSPVLAGPIGATVTVLGKLLSALDNPETPVKYKTLIMGAIGYILLPIDLIPDAIPVVGLLDDLAAASIAIVKVAAFSTFNMKELDAVIDKEESDGEGSESVEHYADDDPWKDDKSIAALLESTVDKVSKTFGELTDKLREVTGADRITYEEAMKYFIDHKGDSPAIAKGAILKEDIESGFMVTQVFLDSNNQLVSDNLGNPLGFKRKVARMEDELLRLFKDGKLVIVE